MRTITEKPSRTITENRNDEDDSGKPLMRTIIESHYNEDDNKTNHSDDDDNRKLF